MKLVEIIILAGTQCASPITPGHLASEVSKVPCAVVIERDTETRSVSVQPPSLSNHPKVRLALAQPAAVPLLPQAIAPSEAPGPQIAPTASAPQSLAAVSPLTGAEAGSGQVSQPVAAAQPAEQKIAALSEAAPALEAGPEVLPSLPAVEGVPTEAVEGVPAEEEPPAAAVQPETPPPVAETPPVKAKAKAKAAAPKKAIRKKTSARAASAAAKPKPVKSAGQCTAPARPLWYTNSAGQRKYRCAKPGAKLSLY